MTNVNNYSGNFQIDAAHSEIGFVARHAMVTKVRGAFTDFEGTATTGLEEGLKAGVEAQASTFEGLAAELKGAVSAENPVVVVIYATRDGTEIYSQEFTAK